MTRVGQGSIRFEVAGGRTGVTRALARSPLRLLTPNRHGLAAWAYTSSFGGGLVDGDRVELDVSVGPDAIALVTTQASTKVYRSPGGCAQTTRASVGARGALALVPDPVACFAGARYDQRVEVRLAGDASLVLVDAFTAGRVAFGERWRAGLYASRIRIDREETTLLRDTLVLDPDHGDVAARMGRFEAMATVVLLGPRFSTVAKELLAELAGRPSARGEGVEAGSPLADGALLRFAANDPELVTTWVRRCFAPVADTFGGDPQLHKG